MNDRLRAAWLYGAVMVTIGLLLGAAGLVFVDWLVQVGVR